LVIVKKTRNLQRERNGASSKPKASTLPYALDTAVVVIDNMTKGESSAAVESFSAIGRSGECL